MKISHTPCAYAVQGVFFMCRKKYMQGWCLVALGLGLILGHCLESWFVCCAGGLGLMVLGWMVMQRR